MGGIGKLLGDGAEKVDSPAPVKQPPAERAEKVATVAAVQSKSSPMIGPPATLLTGPGGVPNDKLNLGRNNLLGL